MPYFMSKSERCVLIHRLTIYYTISVIFFPPHPISRKLDSVRNPANHNYWFCEDDFRISEPENLLASFARMAPTFNVTPRPRSQGPALVPGTHGHLLLLLLGSGDSGEFAKGMCPP